MVGTSPDILLLVLESTPVTHLSCCGHHRPTTPHLDQFAAEGVLYEQAISAAPWTLPSHAGLFTGLYTSQHGTHFGNPYLRNDLVTLAEMLQQRGYATAAFATNDWVNEKFGFGRGFETFRWAKRTLEWLKPLFPAETRLEKTVRYLRDPVYPIGHRNNRLLQDWITRTRRRGRPYFAYTLYFDPHYPYRPQFPYARQFLRGQSRPWWRINLDPDRYMAGAVKMSAEELEVLRGLYDSRLASTDATLGRFLDYLRRCGIMDDTLIFIVADHGENLGEHGLMGHQYCVYDTLVRVPLTIRYPPLFEAGQRVSDQVQTLEIFTTIMDILGIAKSEIPNDVRGRSLVPEKLADDPLPFAVSEYLVPNLVRMRRLYSGYDIARYDRSLRAIRQNGYKFISTSDGQSELYDLNADPGETQNLAPQNPVLVQEMQSRLSNWLASVRATVEVEPEREDVPDVDPMVVKRLQDLGYL
jgi:arylsulfatase A-like enzyme